MTTLTPHPETLAEPLTETPVQQLADVAARSGMTQDDLGELLSAFTEVTDNLQRTHETLRSEVVRLQDELSNANAQLRRAQELAALGEMAAGIAHEIRNPLGSIRLYANILEEDLNDRPSEQEIAMKIAGAVKGLDHIVSDVLDFARELRVRPVLTDVEEMLERAVDSCRDRIESANANVELQEITGGEELRCDPDLMHQALTNLIRNAADAVAENEPELLRQITLRAKATGETLEFIIDDTGPGMPEDVRQRMFNPFFTTRHAGTGLGLAIVHRIIDAHGGRIEVSNKPASGARIVVVMPILNQDQPDRGADPLPIRSHGGDR